MERSGHWHHRSGARLPSGPRPNLDEEAGDAANGDNVPRCLACGVANPIEFGLTLRGKPAGRAPLCEACFRWVNPPPRADPLDVTTS